MVALSSLIGTARTRPPRLDGLGTSWGSSVVEHVLGKDEVAGSNPVPSSIRLRSQAGGGSEASFGVMALLEMCPDKFDNADE